MTCVGTTPEGLSSLSEDPHAGLNKNLALVVLAIAQLMVVLDATIVNVALPDIAKALSVRSNSDLQWVVTGYTLTFGGFLLLGGKHADRIGRRRIFLSGAALFATASLVGGLAGNLGVLLAARAVQGTGGALMSPAALSLITVICAEGKERNRALGIYSAITARGPRPSALGPRPDPAWCPDAVHLLALGLLRQPGRWQQSPPSAPSSSYPSPRTRTPKASTSPARCSSPAS